MAKIQHTNRRGARYTYRRRIYLPDGSTVLLNLPLATADPATARARASALSARFEQIKARLRESEGWKLGGVNLKRNTVDQLIERQRPALQRPRLG
jgi:hypothetical protein